MGLLKPKIVILKVLLLSWAHARARLTLILILIILILRREAIGELGKHSVEVVRHLLVGMTYSVWWRVLWLTKELLAGCRRLAILVVWLWHIAQLLVWLRACQPWRRHSTTLIVEDISLLDLVVVTWNESCWGLAVGMHLSHTVRVGMLPLESSA